MDIKSFFVKACLEHATYNTKQKRRQNKDVIVRAVSYLGTFDLNYTCVGVESDGAKCTFKDYMKGAFFMIRRNKEIFMLFQTTPYLWSTPNSWFSD